MNLLLFTAADRTDDNCIRLTDRRLQHLLDVHKAKIGDPVRVGEVNGSLGTGSIIDINAEQAVLSVTTDTVPPKKLPVEIVLALPRPKMLRRILRSVAEFGTPTLHLINSYRVEKSYWQTPVLNPDTIRHYLIEGLEQAMDTMLPTVHCHKRFKPFVEDIFPSIVEGRDAILAHPGEHPPMTAGTGRRTVLVIGPEGGFIPYEVEHFQAAGCRTVSLGPRILRVENAVSKLLSLAAPDSASTL
ncbi:MAG: 16S rRNA (uracil(1498)-N(3))-methyltransferase [Halioglobus sp.]